MRYYLLAMLLFISFPASAQRAVPVTAGTIDRSQEILRQDETLRQIIGKEGRFFIDKINVKGASKLSANEIRDIIAPFQGNWMTKKDVRQIIDSLKAAYVKKKFDTDHLKITDEIKDPGILEIIVNELTR